MSEISSEFSHCFYNQYLLVHSHASYLIGNGMNIIDVSKRLGHSDITMTLNTYTHFIPHAQDRIATFLNTQKEPFS